MQHMGITVIFFEGIYGGWDTFGLSKAALLTHAMACLKCLAANRFLLFSSRGFEGAMVVTVLPCICGCPEALTWPRRMSCPPTSGSA